MHRVRLKSVNDFAEWRSAARALLLATVPPEEVIWDDPLTPTDLFGDPAQEVVPIGTRAVGRVPPAFIDLAEQAICNTDPDRFGLLYRLLWRVMHDASLMSVRSDPDVEKVHKRASAVRRDSHKMTAFVRFKQVTTGDGRERYAAWFEPEHYILERTAPFFMRRFASMDWAIVTPYRSAFWDGRDLSFGEGGSRVDVPADDALEGVWKTYFASIFNPARLKVSMMQSEMPKKYWRNLPEAELIPELIRGAKEAEREMIHRQASIPPARHMRQEARRTVDPQPAEVPGSLAEAKDAIHNCRRCPLYEHATQPVFGEGPEDAPVMFVGEQPGDQEDLIGRPFVGPAGMVFDQAMREAGFDRSRAYVTNAVKHFKFVPRGKKRLHQRPDGGEIAACRFWVSLEREFVRPKVIVALGATAAQSILGKAIPVTKMRGAPIALEDGSQLFVTVHPSYLLRIPDKKAAAQERARFIADLEQIRDAVAAIVGRG